MLVPYDYTAADLRVRDRSGESPHDDGENSLRNDPSLTRRCNRNHTARRIGNQQEKSVFLSKDRCATAYKRTDHDTLVVLQMQPHTSARN